MNKKQIVASWCQINNWTEPRQLENGIWVAFSPYGVIETPIPCQTFSSTKNEDFFSVTTFLSALLLLLCAVCVGIVAIWIAPYFWLKQITDRG